MTKNNLQQNILVLYHADCLDGFASAYAAYSKFKDGAEYIPVWYNEPPPEHVKGKNVYILDFCYHEPELSTLIEKTNSLVVIDHHKSHEELVSHVPRAVFDLNHSGCVLSWNYFHPGVKIPNLFLYVEDGDLGKRELEDGGEIRAYINSQPFDFTIWGKMVDEFQDKINQKRYKEYGATIKSSHEQIVNTIIKHAEEVEFEGYRVFAVNASRVFRGLLGRKLAKQKPPFAIVWYYERGKFNCSLRGDGTVDLSKIAARYPGGGGHYDAANFRVNADLSSLPFKKVSKG